MPTKSFLDAAGLQYYNQKIQEKIDEKPTIVVVDEEPTEQSTEDYPENTMFIWPSESTQQETLEPAGPPE